MGEPMSDTCESGSEQSETTNEKGRRHENEASDILGRVYGFGVEKVDAWGNSDPFGFIDIIAMQPGSPVLFVQVKTNGFTAADKRKYRHSTRKLPHEHARFQVWVRYDRRGWELFEYDGEEFEKVHQIPVCDTGKARENYARYVEQKEKIPATDGGKARDIGTDE